tara:strand:+ start:4057 stop:4458 length:402 start_codon:yes stop_codon:yes gene_type:complete
MAYAASVTIARKVRAGTAQTILTILETGVTGSTNEWSAEVSTTGTLHYHKCTLVQGDGSGTTVDPIVQEATGTTSTDAVFVNGAAAGVTRNTPDNAHYHVASGVLFGRSTCNGTTGTTGSITTVILLEDSTLW